MVSVVAIFGALKASGPRPCIHCHMYAFPRPKLKPMHKQLMVFIAPNVITNDIHEAHSLINDNHEPGY